MEKLMIGEIQLRYLTFLKNTSNINGTELILAIREEFLNYFDSANEYLEELKLADKKNNNGPSYHKGRLYTSQYFRFGDFKAASIGFKQKHDNPKGRDLIVELIDWGGNKEKIHIIPFIKFHCNPEGMLILEKLCFELII